jgi:release factor glutamine methyltransferase
VIAIDIALDALHVARTNRSMHHVNHRVDLLQADLFTPLPLSTLPAHRHDLICANLPYIPTSILEELPVSKKEPWVALHGGEDGLYPLRNLFKQARRLVSEGGMVLLEIGAEQGEAARSMVKRSFPEAEVDVDQDYAGHDRLLVVMDR